MYVCMYVRTYCMCVCMYVRMYIASPVNVCLGERYARISPQGDINLDHIYNTTR